MKKRTIFSVVGLGLISTLFTLPVGAGIGSNIAAKKPYYYDGFANCGKAGAIEKVYLGLVVSPEQKTARVCVSGSQDNCSPTKNGSEWAALSDFSNWKVTENVNGYQLKVTTDSSQLLSARAISFSLKNGPSNPKTCNAAGILMLRSGN